MRRHLYFLLFVAISSLAFWVPIKQLITFSLTHDYGSHILLIVPLSVYLVYLKRDEVFSEIGVNLVTGPVLFVLGLILLVAARSYPPLRREMLSVEVLALVVLWIAGFILCYGTGAFIKAQFPLLFLLLLVPCVLHESPNFSENGLADDPRHVERPRLFSPAPGAQ